VPEPAALSEEHKALIVATVTQAIEGAPMRPDVKKVAVGAGAGLVALCGALWTWATTQTASVERHETILVGSGVGKSLSAKVDDLGAAVAVEHQAGIDRDRRLDRMQDTLERVAERVGAKK
jgi:hypothetical protein